MSLNGARAMLVALMFVPGLVSAQVAAEPTLMPGDTIQIIYYENEELSGRFAVRTDGSIGHPYYSQIRVTGIPVLEVERQVRAYLSALQGSPMVIVDPFFQVAVSGLVRQPGVYGLGIGSTMAQAVLRAGGPNEQGALNRVVLHRDGRAISLNLTRPGPTMGGMEIRSGDQIVVLRRREIFRDYIVPVASITGAVAAVLNVTLRDR